MYELNYKSIEKLSGVHPDLISVVKEAIKITFCDFIVTEGLRSIERQKKLFEDGKSKTMNSRHLTGHAVDVAAVIFMNDSKTISWDWQYYEEIAEAMKESASNLNVSIIWGGDWKSIKDGCHFELDRKKYP